MQPSRSARSLLASSLAVALATWAVPAPATAGAPWSDHGGGPWVSTWGASPQVPTTPLALSGQTVRQVAHVSLGGHVVRVRLSNAFGTTPLAVSEARVALSTGGSAIDPSTDHPLTFGGSPATTIPAGALVVSDPVWLTVPALSNVAVSLYFPGSVSATTEHSLAVQTTYVSPAGDFASAPEMPAGGTTTSSWYFLNGVEVRSDGRHGAAIVALGDSITDGYASTQDANHRWPNYLAARLQGSYWGSRIAVVDEGISGNRVLHDFVGPNALARLDRDVLAQSGVRWVIVLEGINDIGIPGLTGNAAEEVTADDIIEGHRQIIARAHAKGLKIYGGTLTPFVGTTFPGYYTPEGEVKREAVNHWIRTSGAYDAVIDFDAAVRDPANPTQMLPAFDSGDNLHPNDAGYQAMANAVDLALFLHDD
ncbi:MAG TPA: SGNH/GDSL hydrolase family protein [Anaeromyxobacteraceae bacterium]|nr:SGNH/GDSL hydrolase family protein [Anaeromyxobacteraceae bacterium]